jgi:arylsulfatase
VGKLAATAVDYPPTQSPASFNLQAVKEKVEAILKSREGQ